MCQTSTPTSPTPALTTPSGPPPTTSSTTLYLSLLTCKTPPSHTTSSSTSAVLGCRTAATNGATGATSRLGTESALQRIQASRLWIHWSGLSLPASLMGLVDPRLMEREHQLRESGGTCMRSRRLSWQTHRWHQPGGKCCGSRIEIEHPLYIEKFRYCLQFCWGLRRVRSEWVLYCLCRRALIYR